MRAAGARAHVSLKVLGRTHTTGAAEADSELRRRVESADYRARGERIMPIAVEAFDWNCPQHISPRCAEARVAERTAPFRARIEELERRMGVSDKEAVP